MAYADFTLEKVEADFGLLSRPGTLFPDRSSAPVPAWLTETRLAYATCAWLQFGYVLRLSSTALWGDRVVPTQTRARARVLSQDTYLEHYVRSKYAECSSSGRSRSSIAVPW